MHHLIKALAEEQPRTGALLALKAGVSIDSPTVNKKVSQLNDPSVISMGLTYWSDVICTHERNEGRVILADNLRDQISRLSNAISTFDLSIDHKATITTYFNDIIKEWIKSNTDISLRKPIDIVAQELKVEYISLATIAKERNKTAAEEEEKKKAEKEKSKYAQKWNSNDYPKPKFEKAEDGDVICKSYNAGNCRFKWCKFRHICNNCLGSHMAKNCPKLGTKNLETAT